MPGGGMEWGESLLETAQRELQEETGLTAVLGEVAGTFSRWFTAQESARGEAGHMACIIFHATGITGHLREEFTEPTTDAAQWFSIEDAEQVAHVDLVDFVLKLVRGGARFGAR